MKSLLKPIVFLVLVSILLNPLIYSQIQPLTQPQTPSRVSVPKVVGMKLPDAEKSIQDAGLIIANIIAWPLAWIIMKYWLQDFAYRIDIGIGPFILSSLLALIIAWMTVSFQTLKAGKANPVDALKYE